MFKKLVGMLFLAECMMAMSAWGRSISLDLRSPSEITGTHVHAKAKSAEAQCDTADGLLRKVNLDAGVADVGGVTVGDELTFTLFDDVEITLTLKEKMPSPLGGDVFIAEAVGYEGVKNAVVLRTADGLTVDVQDYRNGKVYKVISTANGVGVREIDASKSGTCGCDAQDMPVLEGNATEKRPRTKKTVIAKNDEDVVCVDILVAYDSNAKVWANANGGGLLNFAQMAVQKMNTVLYNNELNAYFRFRLVGIVDVSVSSTDFRSVLTAAMNGNGGWAPIKAKRDEVGADIVTVLIDTGSAYGTTGLGSSLRSTDYENNTFSEKPYNVCAIRSVAQSHTMTHEVGHNMGCGHSDVQTSEPGPQLFDHSAGFYYSIDGEKYHTIMAYGGEGPGGLPAPYFSSRFSFYDDMNRLFYTGDKTHDNELTLYYTYNQASSWRAEKGIDLGGDDVSLEPLEWLRSRDEAFAKARSEGKKVFVVCGRDSCFNTQTTRSECEDLAVKRHLLQNYVCWYNLYDTESDQVSSYLSGYDVGFTFPFIAVIDVAKNRTLAAEGGIHYVNDLRIMLGRVAKEITFSPVSGTGFYGLTSVTLTATPGTPIYYTLDGTMPWEGSAICYEGPAKVNASTTIWAATFTGGIWGMPVSADFVKLGTKNYDLYRCQNYDGAAPVKASPQLEYGGTAWWNAGVPWRAGYTFAGWFTAASGGVMVYDSTGKCVTGDYWTADKCYAHDGNLVVYAHWNLKQYSLTRNPNGGTYQGKTTATVTANALTYTSGAYCEIGVPSRDGYTFAGWYSAASGGVMVYDAAGKCVTGDYWTSDKRYCYAGDLAVYAHWTASAAKYTLTRNPNGGTYQGKTTAITTANALVYGTTAYWDIGVPTRDGYTFAGWFTAASGGVKVYDADGKCVAGGTYWNASKQYIKAGALTVYAQWTVKKYTLTRNPNGGTYQGKTTAIAAANALAYGTTAYWDIGVPTRTGYVFTGWFTAASGGVKVYDADGKCVAGGAYWNASKQYCYSGNLTVYAQWVGPGTKLTLTRNPNGGTYQGKTAATIAANSLTYDSTSYWDIGVPTRNGYVFTGWWTAASGGVKVYDADGKCVAGDYWTADKRYCHAGDLVVYARWVAQGTKYALTRNPNGGTYQGKTTAITTANALTIGAASYWDIGVPTRDGYMFTGWWTAASGGVKVYDAGGKCVAGGAYWNASKQYVNAGALTVYAQWTEKKYTLTRNPNGGMYQDKTAATTVANALKNGSTAYNSIGVPTRAGYTFDGWYTSSSGGTRVYDANGRYVAGSYWTSDGRYNYSGNLYVYAHWSPTLGLALDNTALTFTTGGDSPWVVQTAYTHDGGYAARSGALSASQSSWVQTTVSGVGMVSFWWYASSESGYDKLEFLIDDEVKDTISGTDNNWIDRSFTVTSSGSHVLQWRYRKDYSVDNGLDAGFLDQVVWTSAKYRLTRDPNGGSYLGKYTTSVAANALAYGETAYWDIGVPTRSGYVFTGWWTAASGGTKVYGADGKCVAGTYWDAARRYTHNGDLTVYAQWVATGSKHTLKRYPNGGTYKGVTSVSTATDGLVVGSTAYWDIGVPTWSGYTFLGWFTSTSGGKKVYDAAGKCVAGTYWNSSKQYIYDDDLTVYAMWVANGTKFSLTRDPNGGTYQGKTTSIVTSGALTVGATSYWDIGVPTRDGYIFNGWFTDEIGGEKVYDASGKCVAGTYWNSSKQYCYDRNLTVYAQWTKTASNNSSVGNTSKGKSARAAATLQQAFDTYWEDVSAGTLDTSFAKAQTADGALYDKDNELVGIVQVKAGKINARKGTVKLSATATLIMNGAAKKITAKAVTVDAGGAVGTTLTFKAPIGEMAFEMASDGSFKLKNDSYLMVAATIGGALKKNGEQGTFRLEDFDLAVPDEVQDDLLPYEETFGIVGGKWKFVDSPSSLKLTYTAKTGQFKGSFKVFALDGEGNATGRKKYTVDVIGFVANGVGYGEASCKKPSGGPWAVTVE